MGVQPEKKTARKAPNGRPLFFLTFRRSLFEAFFDSKVWAKINLFLFAQVPFRTPTNNSLHHAHKRSKLQVFLVHLHVSSRLIPRLLFRPYCDRFGDVSLVVEVGRW